VDPGGLACLRDRRLGNVFAAFLILLLVQVLTTATHAADGDERISELEVAYIYNFTRFIQWPEAPPGRPFVIGVVGDPVMEEALRVLERDGKRVDGRHIEVRGLATPDDIESCSILFVGGGAADQLGAIVRRTAGKPTLLVGDTPGMAGRGVAIELFRKPDIFRKSERLRFRIDPKAVKDRGLVVSAGLYDVAEVVR
jgi:hypothetical protein